MPALCPMLQIQYYAQNYAGIIRQTLLQSEPLKKESVIINFFFFKMSFSWGIYLWILLPLDSSFHKQKDHLSGLKIIGIALYQNGTFFVQNMFKPKSFIPSEISKPTGVQAPFSSELPVVKRVSISKIMITIATKKCLATNFIYHWHAYFHSYKDSAVSVQTKRNTEEKM